MLTLHTDAYKHSPRSLAIQTNVCIQCFVLLHSFEFLRNLNEKVNVSRPIDIYIAHEARFVFCFFFLLTVQNAPTPISIPHKISTLDFNVPWSLNNARRKTTFRYFVSSIEKFNLIAIVGMQFERRMPKKCVTKRIDCDTHRSARWSIHDAYLLLFLLFCYLMADTVYCFDNERVCVCVCLCVRSHVITNWIHSARSHWCSRQTQWLVACTPSLYSHNFVFFFLYKLARYLWQVSRHILDFVV